MIVLPQLLTTAQNSTLPPPSTPLQTPQNICSPSRQPLPAVRLHHTLELVQLLLKVIDRPPHGLAWKLRCSEGEASTDANSADGIKTICVLYDGELRVLSEDVDDGLRVANFVGVADVLYDGLDSCC